MAHIRVTLRARRGCSLRCWVPENSASYSCPAPLVSLRNMATTKSISPNPPIHCVKARYTSNPAGSSSGFDTTDEPVVVNPLNDSNTASVNDAKPPVKR